MSEQQHEPLQIEDGVGVDQSEFDLIPVLTAAAVMSDHRASNHDLLPAEALAAIARFDLSAFEWCPKDREQYRLFLTRYVPASVLHSVMLFDDQDFDSFLRGWEPGSEWGPIFLAMVALARHGAVRAYQALLAEEAEPATSAGIVKRGRSRVEARDDQGDQHGSGTHEHKGVSTIQ